MIQGVRERFGSVTVLFNNAAYLTGFGTVTETDDALWDLAIRTSLTGAFLCSKYSIPHIVEAGGGSIISTASVRRSRHIQRKRAVLHGQGRPDHAYEVDCRRLRKSGNSGQRDCSPEPSIRRLTISTRTTPKCRPTGSGNRCWAGRWAVRKKSRQRRCFWQAKSLLSSLGRCCPWMADGWRRSRSGALCSTIRTRRGTSRSSAHSSISHARRIRCLRVALAADGFRGTIGAQPSIEF